MRNRNVKKPRAQKDPNESMIEEHLTGERFYLRESEEETLSRSFSHLCLSFPEKSTDLENLPDKCYTDMSFLFKVLMEYPMQRKDPEEIFSFNEYRVPVKSKSEAEPKLSQLYRTDMRVDGCLLKDVIVWPEYALPVMNSNLFYALYGGKNGNQDIIKKETLDNRKITGKLFSDLKVEGVRNIRFEWNGMKTIKTCLIVRDFEPGLVVGSSVNGVFCREKINMMRDSSIFYKRISSSLPSISYIANLADLMEILSNYMKNYQPQNIETAMEIRHFLAAATATIERWTIEKKRAILQAKLTKTSRTVDEAMNGKYSKGIQALYDFFLNTLRLSFFLPKGKNYRRLRCRCDHDGHMFASVFEKVNQDLRKFTTQPSIATDRKEKLMRMCIGQFVLEKKTENAHLHKCSNFRCGRRESSQGQFRVCEECRGKKSLARHYYCSRSCQLEEWSWSHEIFHTLFSREEKNDIDIKDTFKRRTR